MVVGDGSERARLARDLPGNVTLLGRVAAEDLPGLYQGARALVFPAEEDFGIVPLEAMACGTPVIAYGRGGARDSVIEGKTGLFFFEQTAAAIRAALNTFEKGDVDFDAKALNAHARKFGAERFRREFAAIVEAELRDTGRAGGPAGAASAMTEAAREAS